MATLAAREPAVAEHKTARGVAPNGPPEAAQQQQEQPQREQQPRDGPQRAASPPPPDAASPARQQLAADALAAQFQAQLEALTAISMGEVAPESTVLAACGGRIPAAAVADLAAAARAQQQRAADDAATQQRQQELGAAGSSEELPEGEQLQHAIRAKLRRLAPQQQRLREEVLQERELLTKTNEFELLDWRQLRRPLPGANPRAFEPPLQPVALLLQQQAVRAARGAAASRAHRAVLLRQHLKRQMEQQQQQQQEQQQQQPGSAPLAATIGGPSSGANGQLGAGHPAQQLHPLNPFLLRREQALATAAGGQQPQQPMDVDGPVQLQQQPPAPPQQQQQQHQAG